MQAKNEMNFGRQKNRILRPQNQTADEVRRSVRVRGKEHRMGGRHFRKESRAHNLELAFWKLKYWGKKNLARIWKDHPARTALPSGGGGCAAHVPPRCRVVMKSRE